MNLVAQMLQVKSGLLSPGAPFELTRVKSKQGEFTAYLNAPKTLVDIINTSRRDDEACFLVYEGQRWSFKRFFAEVDAVASWLHANGIAAGDRVAIAMRNRPEWVIGFVAVALVGAVPAPLNSFGLADELHAALDELQPKLLICDTDRLARIAQRSAQLNCAALCVGEAVEQVNSFDFAEAVKHPVEERPAVQLNGDDPALILFTSGATSRAKAVQSSHFAVCQALFNIDYISALSAMTSPDIVQRIQKIAKPSVILTAVPLFHVSGLHAQLLTALRTGRQLVFMHRWSPEQAVKMIKEEQVTQFNGAPSMVMQLLREPDFLSKEILDNFIGLGFGGAGLPASLVDKTLQSLPEQMVGIGFGMTESNGVGAAISGELFRLRPKASGLISPIMEVRVCAADGRVLSAGETGEIQLRGIAIMDGYVSGQGLNRDPISRDGWLSTGDLGFVDADGFIFIVDRLKDVINRAGENISAAEVESCLLHHEDVLEVAVFGIPDEEMGEAVVAVVSLKLGAEANEDDLKKFVGQHLAAYKVPSRVQVMEEKLPRNPAGKLLKNKLKAQLFA